MSILSQEKPTISELEEEYWELKNEVITGDDLAAVPEGTVLLSRNGWAAQIFGECLYVTVGDHQESVKFREDAELAVKKWGPFKILHVFEKEFKWNLPPQANGG